MQIENQLSSLEEQGLIIDDRKLALEFLQHVGMHRLEEYFTYFRDPQTQIFFDDLPFKRIVRVYIFDRRLRGLILDGIERVETALRANIYHQLELLCRTKKWHQEDIFRTPGFWQNFKKNHEESWMKMPKYRDFVEKNPKVDIPIHLILEICSFGSLLEFLFALKNFFVTNIAKELGIMSYSKFHNWLHGLRYLRNRCAHHERIWNRKMTLSMKIPKGREAEFASQNSIGAYLKIIDLLLGTIAPRSTWKKRLCDLIREFNITPEKMELEDFCE